VCVCVVGHVVHLLSQVLITIYWLGRKAHLDTLYDGPQLNFKAFEGLLGLALSKVNGSSRLFTIFVVKKYIYFYFLTAFYI